MGEVEEVGGGGEEGEEGEEEGEWGESGGGEEKTPFDEDVGGALGEDEGEGGRDVRRGEGEGKESMWGEGDGWVLTQKFATLSSKMPRAKGKIRCTTWPSSLKG